MAKLRERSKVIIWLNPQSPSKWNISDSDMLKYLPYVQAVHKVSTLAELTLAVDNLFKG